MVDEVCRGLTGSLGALQSSTGSHQKLQNRWMVIGMPEAIRIGRWVEGAQ